MAVEWAKYNIRINDATPGLVMNPETEILFRDEKVKDWVAGLTFRGVRSVEEIANAVLVWHRRNVAK